MKKLLVAITVVSIGILGFSGIAVAKNAQVPIADVTGLGCDLVQIAPFGTSLLARWSWQEAAGGQVKFGGDAVYLVQADDGALFFDGEIEFELEQYEPGMPAADYEGVLVYRCSNPVSDASGTCNGSVLGVRAAIRNAAASELGVEPETITSLEATLVGVYVKALNPKNGRQNYELVNVCDEPL